MVFLKRFGMLFALMVLSGCALPLVDPELSLTLITKSKLGSPLISFVYTGNIPDSFALSQNNSESELIFLPENDPHPAKGVVVHRKPNQFELYFLDSQNLTGPKFAYDLMAQDGAYFQPSMLPNTTTQTNRVYFLYEISYFFMSTKIRHGDLSNQSNADSLSMYDPNSFLAAGAVQCSYPTGKFHNSFVSVENGSDLKFRGIYTSNPQVDAPSFSQLDSSFESPQDILSKNYKIGRNTVFFLGKSSSDLYFVLSLEKDQLFDNYLYKYDTPTMKMIKLKEYSFKGRIESTINNATQILVRNANYYEVYDSDGGLVYRFPAGRLRFVHERFDSSQSQWFSVFSVILINSDAFSRQMKVEVYEYPSANLVDLRS